MSKRRGTDQLTGGSGDVNPQTMIIRVAQTGADANTMVVQPLPLPRIPVKPNRQLLIELLKVKFTIAAIQGGTINHVILNLTTNPTVLATEDAIFTDPRSISTFYRISTFATAVGFSINNGEEVYDLTDASGHGILIGTDNINLQLFSAGTNLTNIGYARLEYRFKDVSLQEYVGIVQSQQ